MSRAVAGIDYCSYCSVVPRHPCHSDQEARNCPNSASYDPETDEEKVRRLTDELARMTQSRDEWEAGHTSLLDDYSKSIDELCAAQNALKIARQKLVAACDANGAEYHSTLGVLTDLGLSVVDS